jgi:hypothetical protein
MRRRGPIATMRSSRVNIAPSRRIPSSPSARPRRGTGPRSVKSCEQPVMSQSGTDAMIQRHFAENTTAAPGNHNGPGKEKRHGLSASMLRPANLLGCEAGALRRGKDADFGNNAKSSQACLRPRPTWQDRRARILPLQTTRSSWAYYFPPTASVAARASPRSRPSTFR